MSSPKSTLSKKKKKKHHHAASSATTSSTIADNDNASASTSGGDDDDNNVVVVDPSRTRLAALSDHERQLLSQLRVLLDAEKSKRTHWDERFFVCFVL